MCIEKALLGAFERAWNVHITGKSEVPRWGCQVMNVE